MKLFFPFFFFGIICLSNAFSQTNQVDDQGRPHGIWEKYYEGTGQLRYKGQFEHGKEVGEFRFYCEDCKDRPIAIKIFNPNDNISEVTFFSPKGNIVSKGKMKGKERIGEWITFHPDSKMPVVRETYSNGKLDGKQTTYYPDGNITEELNFSNGFKDGPNIYYSPAGITIKNLQYKNDKLHGPVNYYDAHGNLIIEGYYQNDVKNGQWIYYKDGKVVVEETFPKKNRE